MKILLDTSVIIDFLRRKDKERSLLYSLAKKDYQIHLSIITHTELYAGKSVWENKKAAIELETLFSGMNLLLLDEEISKSAGKIKALYNIHLIDAIIAATAIYHELDLATLNLKDFQKIKGLKLFANNITS